MSNAEDIRDENSLWAWLETQPHEVSVLIANRAALRMMPVWADYCLFGDGKKRDVTPMVVLRSTLILSVAAVSPTDDMKDAAACAYVSDLSFDVTDTATNEIAIAACASAGAFAFDLIASDIAVGTLATVGEVWRAVKADARAIEAGRDVASAPLWPGKGPEANPLSGLWRKVASQGFTPDSPYDFWRRWYETLLDPTRHPPMPFDMLKDIALIDPKIWKGPPEALAAEIASIEAGYGGADMAQQDQSPPPSTALVSKGVDDMLERNTKEVRAQLQALRVLVEEELSKLYRTSNSVSEEGRSRRERRVNILQEILDSIQRIEEALEQDTSDPGTALVVVSEQLPAITEKAEELPDTSEDVQVSQTILMMAASVETLVKAGVPGDAAEKYAAAELGTNKMGSIFSKFLKRFQW